MPDPVGVCKCNFNWLHTNAVTIVFSGVSGVHFLDHFFVQKYSMIYQFV